MLYDRSVTRIPGGGDIDHVLSPEFGVELICSIAGQEDTDCRIEQI